MNKLFQILGAVTLLSMLSACSDFRKAIGTEKSSPDEFQVVVRPSLVLPPNFSSRPTAATGAQTAATVASDAQAQASVLLGARETGASDYSDIFAFDKIVEDVRSKVDEETAGIKFLVACLTLVLLSIRWQKIDVSAAIGWKIEAFHMARHLLSIRCFKTAFWLSRSPDGRCYSSSARAAC